SSTTNGKYRTFGYSIFEGAIKMLVRDIMAENPKLVFPENNLQQAAKIMAEINCGALPVVENNETKKLIGVITDRDITCKGVARGLDPASVPVREIMTVSPVTVSPGTPIEECCELMETRQIRRIPVVDEDGSCCGIVCQ